MQPNLRVNDMYFFSRILRISEYSAVLHNDPQNIWKKNKKTF